MEHGGGGAADVKQIIESGAKSRLEQGVDDIGFGAVTREDEVFLVSAETGRRHRIPSALMRPLVSGEELRDWHITEPVVAIWPYDAEDLKVAEHEQIVRFLWCWKNQLSRRVAFGKTQLARGLKWFEYSMFFRERSRSSLTIALASVATHNHFVLDRGGKVFKDTAPIIKLKAGSSEVEHL